MYYKADKTGFCLRSRFDPLRNGNQGYIRYSSRSSGACNDCTNYQAHPALIRWFTIKLKSKMCMTHFKSWHNMIKSWKAGCIKLAIQWAFCPKITPSQTETVRYIRCTCLRDGVWTHTEPPANCNAASILPRWWLCTWARERYQKYNITLIASPQPCQCV